MCFNDYTCRCLFDKLFIIEYMVMTRLTSQIPLYVLIQSTVCYGHTMSIMVYCPVIIPSHQRSKVSITCTHTHSLIHSTDRLSCITCTCIYPLLLSYPFNRYYKDYSCITCTCIYPLLLSYPFNRYYRDYSCSSSLSAPVQRCSNHTPSWCP